MTVMQEPTTAEVDALDAAAVLAGVAAAERAERQASLAKVELALQWCVLHPATADTGAAVWGDAGLPGLSGCDETLGGDGCPQVSAFAPEPFAAALGMSTTAGMQLLGDSLDLAHRLPRTLAAVRALDLPAWKGRRLAQATHHLSREAANIVDTRLADRLDTCGAGLIDRTVAQVAAMLDTQGQTDAERAAHDSWDVTLVHRADGGWAGTSHLQATGDTLDLTRFYDAVCDHAARLAELGDLDPLGVRKAKALGAIADAQAQLDLYGASAAGDDAAVRRPSLARTRAYVHFSLNDLLDGLTRGRAGVGEAERLGPLTLDTIREWLSSTRATVVPVLDLGRDDAVDVHDPPEWMRETVVLRDEHCVFPWCRRDARSCDLDHIEPYVDPGDGGPPGQTRPSMLAPLCRRHHRAKTAGRWGYRREPDGSYTWQGPHGLSFTVTRDTTTRRHPA